MNAGRRILVAYYSLSGNTERVALELAARLGADCERITDLANRRGLFGHIGATLDSIRERPARLAGTLKNPRDYALCVVGTPIWAGKITPAARAYLQLHRGKFNEAAFFITSGSTDVEKVAPAMELLAGCKAAAVAGFDHEVLKSEAAYQQKIAAFDAALRDAGRYRANSGVTAHASV
jgi:flavodoxin